MDNVLVPDAHNAALDMIKNHEGLVRYVWDDSKHDYDVVNTPYNPDDISAYPVYDDSNWKNTWIPGSTTSYDEWMKTVKGNPTLGYGMRYDLLPQDKKNEYLQSYGDIGHEWIENAVTGRMNSIMKDATRNYPGMLKLNPNQQAALADLFYNIGPGTAGRDRLSASIRSGDAKSITDSINRYIYAGGRQLKGLVTRRANETELFNKPYQTQQTTTQPAPVQTVPSGYTVKEGDSLWGMWKNRADKAETWDKYQQRIGSANPGVDLRSLKPGQQLQGIK